MLSCVGKFDQCKPQMVRSAGEQLVVTLWLALVTWMFPKTKRRHLFGRCSLLALDYCPSQNHREKKKMKYSPTPPLESRVPGCPILEQGFWVKQKTKQTYIQDENHTARSFFLDEWCFKHSVLYMWSFELIQSVYVAVNGSHRRRLSSKEMSVCLHRSLDVLLNFIHEPGKIKFPEHSHFSPTLSCHTAYLILYTEAAHPPHLPWILTWTWCYWSSCPETGVWWSDSWLTKRAGWTVLSPDLEGEKYKILWHLLILRMDFL